MINTDELLLFRNFKYEDTFKKMAWLINSYNAGETDAYPTEKLVKTMYECTNDIVEISMNMGFRGNLYHNFLTYIMVNSENAFSVESEIRGKINGSITEIALHDFAIMKELYDFDIRLIDRQLGKTCLTFLTDYENETESSKYFNKRIRDRINELSERLALAADEHKFEDIMAEFYGEFGVGKLGLHKAFRIGHDENDKVEILPITSTEHVSLDDLVGYELQKKKLIDNTEAFVSGKKANNVLLYGDAGTGKSSSIKAILNEYYDRGLRMIEVYKHQFKDLSQVIAQIKDRNYKFIIYMDDLSFEDFEIEYKYLKAIIEGGLEKKPDNVLIYATSNRRHLIREKYSDKEDRAEDLHTSDTVQEKLSLSARFGVSIYYIAPNKKEYNNIIKVLADRYNIKMDEEKLYLEANKWELSHGGLSGRTAQQFINYLLGQEKDMTE